MAVPLTGLTLSVFVDRPGAETAISVLIVVSIATVSWYVVYTALVVQVTFDSDGVEYRGLFRTINVTWGEVRLIGGSAFWGTYLSTNRGTLLVSEYFRGFAQLLREARRHGVKVAVRPDSVD